MAWESVPGNSAGSMNGDGSRKLLLHSTEGSTIEGAIGAYRKNNSWPTLTVDCKRRRVVRHLADTVAARSLRNRAGGVETNREGTILIQIELVGFAGDPASIGSREDLVWLGAEVVGPLCRRNAIPIASSLRWAPYPQSYGEQAAQRLSGAAWDAYSGVCAHQHAPENDHGDCGAIDIATILSAARGDDMPLSTEDIEAVKSAMRLVLNEGTGRGQSTWAGTSAATLAAAQSGINKLNALSAAVADLNDGEDLDESQVAALVVAALSPQAIADALDDSIAAEVADLLAARLAS